MIANDISYVAPNGVTYQLNNDGRLVKYEFDIPNEMAEQHFLDPDGPAAQAAISEALVGTPHLKGIFWGFIGLPANGLQKIQVTAQLVRLIDLATQEEQ